MTPISKRTKKREPVLSVAADRLTAKRLEAYEVLDLLHHLLHTNERIVFERVGDLFEPDSRDASSEPAERELPFSVEVSTYLRKRDEVDGEPAEVESGPFGTIAEALRRALEMHRDRDRERLKRHAVALRRTCRDEPKGAQAEYTFSAPLDAYTSGSPGLSSTTPQLKDFDWAAVMPEHLKEKARLSAKVGKLSPIATSKAKPLKKLRRRSSTKA